MKSREELIEESNKEFLGEFILTLIIIFLTLAFVFGLFTLLIGIA